MTDNNGKHSLYEEYASTLMGAVDLSAADLIDQVAILIRQALDASPRGQRELASILGVSEARVSQVVNGDGNLRVGAVAKYLGALGYSAKLVASAAEEGLPELPRKGPGRPRRRRSDEMANSVGSSKEIRRQYLYTFSAPAIVQEARFDAHAEPITPSPQIYFGSLVDDNAHK